jgi:hypothetical protein
MELWNVRIFAHIPAAPTWNDLGFETPLEWKIDGAVECRDLRGRPSGRPYASDLRF